MSTHDMYFSKQNKNHIFKIIQDLVLKETAIDINDNKEYPAILKLNSITKKLTIKNGKKNLSVKSISVKHGKVNSTCYIIDKKIAYISDISDINQKDFGYFKNLQYLIIDCLWLRFHPSHLNL